MNIRFKFSVLLVMIGLMLAFLPDQHKNAFKISPKQYTAMATDESFYITVDQVARFLNNEDTTIQLIDVRNNDEFRVCNLPGSINIPFDNMLDREWQGYLNQERVRNIFYSDGDRLSASAWAICAGLGYRNNFIMKGGLNEWYATVMNSRFEGARITASENALFENRYNARKLFTEFNSLPDSLKFKLLIAKEAERAKLDGGCE